MESTATAIRQPSFMLRILPNIGAFFIGLAVAYYLEWGTTDLVWSLWLCSLVLGYATILSVVVGGAYVGFHLIRHEDFKKQYRIPAILGGLGMGLFFLGFFSFHFCGCHAGHSVFLRQFFPIDGMPDDGFGEAFVNPFLLWVLVLRHLVKPYGAFILPAIIAERKHVFKPLIRALKIVKKGKAEERPQKNAVNQRREKERRLFGDALRRPYLNVVRMHLLIFFFAFCHFLKLDSFVVYAVVYFVYFFPWSEV